jgi:hypothetical protein
LGVGDGGCGVKCARDVEADACVQPAGIDEEKPRFGYFFGGNGCHGFDTVRPRGSFDGHGGKDEFCELTSVRTFGRFIL